MIFPTIRTLEDLCDFATVEDLLAHYRASGGLRRILPRDLGSAGAADDRADAYRA